MKSPNKDQKGRLFIGDMFTCEGCPYYVTSFPTRSMVCGTAKYQISGFSSGGKFNVKDIKWMPLVNTLRRSERHLIGRALCFGSTLLTSTTSTTQVDSERKLLLRAIVGHRNVMDSQKLTGKVIR